MRLPRLRPPHPSVVRDADLRRWRERFADATPIVDLEPRRPGTCVGVVSQLRLVPDQRFEAQLEDGTGTLVATWEGRSSLPGVRLDSGLRLSGTVAVDPDGRPHMLNPAWALVEPPYA